MDRDTRNTLKKAGLNDSVITIVEKYSPKKK